MSSQRTGKQLAQAQGQPPQEISVLRLADVKCSILHQLSSLRNLAVLVIQSSCRIHKLTLLNMPALKSFTGQSGLKQLLIKECQSLRVVNVSKNQLQRLSIQKCTQLKSLICNDNNLERIEDLPGSLQTVILSKNKITSLELIPVLSKCRKLSLSNNGVSSIAGIGHFKLLRELRLNSNSLVQLPQEMNQLCKLQLLDIGNNLIANIHPALKLRVSNLNVSSNSLDANQFLRHFSEVKILNSKKLAEPVQPVESVPDYSQVLEKRQQAAGGVKRVRVVSETRGLSSKVLEKKLMKRH